MQMHEIASAIAKKEGHNSKARIRDLSEMLAILADLSYQSPDPLNSIVKLGIARAKRKRKNAKS